MLIQFCLGVVLSVSEMILRLFKVVLTDCLISGKGMTKIPRGGIFENFWPGG